MTRLCHWTDYIKNTPMLEQCLPKLINGDRLIGLKVGISTNREVEGSILGTSTILNVDQIWKGVHPAS